MDGFETWLNLALKTIILQLFLEYKSENKYSWEYSKRTLISQHAHMNT